jgi:anti-anti-sigma factor
MEIASENHGQVLLLRPDGRLDTETAGDLELALHDAFESGRRHFVLDLARISYVSSAGLRVLLALAKKLDGGNGTLRLAALNASVKQVFDIAGFTALFDIRATHKAALDKHPFAGDAAAPAPASAPASTPVPVPEAASPPPPAAMPTVGSVAARLLGAETPMPATSPEHRAAAEAAARLLGATPASAKTGAPHPEAVGTPASAPAPAARDDVPPAAAKPGLFSRLLGRK